MNLKNTVSLFLIALCFSCNEDQKLSTLKVVDDDTFAEENKISPIIAEGLEIKLWAPGPLLSNAVALTIDNQGIAYVAETSRRKSSDIDIRQHTDWKYEDLSLETMEDTRAFHMTQLATSLSDQNKWLEDLNGDSLHDYRDLEVESEYIRRIWDSDGDGRADRSQIYADEFNEMLTGIAAGILSHGDDIYMTAAPDLWRLEDVDDDGFADRRQSLSYGYGIHIAYAGHDMSGLTMGPDGRIYWSIGDMGVNTRDDHGNRLAYPHEGAIMRAELDGSNLEIFAHGLRNPQEIAFDAFGNLITVDNDGDHPGEHERYVHVLEGSDSGWRIHWQYGKYDLPNEDYKIWMDERLNVTHFDGQAAYLLPPIALAYNGPAGLAFNPGTALNDQWTDYFFASFFTASSASSKIQAFKLTPNGASFKIDSIQDILGGIVPTGITFGPDGGLYLNDWKDSYAKKPEGRIWKIDASPSNKHPLAHNTKEILASGTNELSTTALEHQLDYTDQRVRLAAQFELVKRQEETLLKSIAMGSNSLIQRIHAIWGLGQLARTNPSVLSSMLPLLDDPHPEIRAQVAKVCGEAKYTEGFDKILPLLEDRTPRVQLYASEAIGKLGNKNAFPALINILETIGESDPHLRHAVVFALSKISSPLELQNLSGHRSEHVRLGAVVALRQLRDTAITVFLDDTSTLVQMEVVRAINDDRSIPLAIPSLGAALENTTCISEVFIRRAINANLREGNLESALRLARFSMDEKVTMEMRLDALWALGHWKKPLVLDRVDGSYRELSGHKLNEAHQAVAELVPLIKSSSNNLLRAAIIEAIGRLDYKKEADMIYNLYWNSNEADVVKLAIIQTLKELAHPRLNEIISNGLTHKNAKIRGLILDNINELKVSDDEKARLYNEIIENNPISEKQKAVKSLTSLTSDKATSILLDLMQKLIGDKVEPGLQLDIYNAAQKRKNASIRTLVSDFEDVLSQRGLAEQYAMSLEGGNKDKGRQIFIRNNSAQCLRCHAAGGFGGDIGPELSHIASELTKTELLESLVEPNARLAPGYGSIYITMKDGKELSGVIQKEGKNELVLKIGEEVKILKRENISELEQLPSGMLNMVDLLSRDQIRDLMAFLVTLE